TSESRSQFFVEVLENGVLYIYNDFLTYKRMNQLYTPKSIEKYLQTLGTVIEPTVLLDDNLTPSSFPEGGIDYQFNFVLASHLREEAIKIKKEHYKSYLGSNIEFKESPEFDMVIHFHNFNAVLLHHKVICLMLMGLLNVNQADGYSEN
ncbi:MAG: hypothetical protein KAR20_16455, partial [Candidatus Heimdallarchaeota archaeon]|nr:hypothetical protein [Candidatus Heimdallarchaeota archaeon]